MTRGDQRERDRAKNQAKLAAGKAKKSGNPQQRREADAKALQEAIAAKAAKKATEDANGGGQAGAGKAAEKKK